MSTLTIRATGALRLALDRLSIYLPIILMGVLALGTVWLVRITPQLVAPAPAAPARHEPDYTMQQFSVRTFGPQGALRSEILGELASHFPDTDTLEISKARIRTLDGQSRLTVATASRALSNADGSEVQLFGNATVVREAWTDAQGNQQPRIEFHSEFLHAFTDTQRVVSNRPVTMVRGPTSARADSFEFDNLKRTAQLSGRVRATLTPRTP